jgi:hypothetical protein
MVCASSVVLLLGSSARVMLPSFKRFYLIIIRERCREMCSIQYD